MDTLDAEVSARSHEDALVLDYMMRTQQDLQNTILEHFGSDSYKGEQERGDEQPPEHAGGSASSVAEQALQREEEHAADDVA